MEALLLHDLLLSADRVEVLEIDCVEFGQIYAHQLYIDLSDLIVLILEKSAGDFLKINECELIIIDTYQGCRLIYIFLHDHFHGESADLAGAFF